MSVLIKGMEMPKVRDTLVLVKTDGTAIVYEDEAYVTTAVPVPDHGDLIDRDALLDAWDDRHTIPSKAAKVIEKTVIPADREGEA